ncbi:MAG: hypothetical protein FWD23_07850 [Oscillospiraceae bacterium]|nr:hypothetical protein [Oscillospiraceae bacterium]
MDSIIMNEIKNMDNITFWFEYECDENGNTIKETDYGADGSIFYRNENEYDKNGNMIKQNIYNADGSIDIWVEYEYIAMDIIN